MANEDKKAADLTSALDKIKGLGLGHTDADTREDHTGYRGETSDPTTKEGPSGLEAALAGITSKNAPDKTETPGAQATETVEAPAPATTEAPKGEDTDKVRRYLKLKGLSDTALDAIPEEELVSMRASFLEADHQRARLLEETNDLRAKNERQTAESAKEAEPKRMVPAATKELDAQLETLVDDGDLSESAAKTLSAAIAASTQAVLDQVQERLAPIEEQGASAKAAGEAEVQRVKAEIRAEVGERFPGLAGADAAEGIDETFSLLASQKRFADLYASEGREATIRALYEATAGAHGIVEVDTTGDADRKSKRRAARANGTPDTTQRRSAAVDQLSQEPAAIALRSINRHRSKAGAKW